MCIAEPQMYRRTAGFCLFRMQAEKDRSLSGQPAWAWQRCASGGELLSDCAISSSPSPSPSLSRDDNGDAWHEISPVYFLAASSCSRVLMVSMGCRQHASMVPPMDPERMHRSPPRSQVGHIACDPCECQICVEEPKAVAWTRWLPDEDPRRVTSLDRGGGGAVRQVHWTRPQGGALTCSRFYKGTQRHNFHAPVSAQRGPASGCSGPHGSKGLARRAGLEIF